LSVVVPSLRFELRPDRRVALSGLNGTATHQSLEVIIFGHGYPRFGLHAPAAEPIRIAEQHIPESLAPFAHTGGSAGAATQAQRRDTLDGRLLPLVNRASILR
jgi:hypothetical protein